MRFNQGFLVLGLIVGALVALAVFTSFRMGRSQQRAMEQALRHGMEMAIDEAASANKLGTNGAWLSSETLREILRNAEEHQKPHRILPSFVRPAEVFLLSKSVLIPSTNLVLVVRMDNGHFYGITADRNWRTVEKNEFVTWPGEPLITNHIDREGVSYNEAMKALRFFWPD